MNILTLIAIALSVSADAFVTSICDGLAYRPKPAKRIIVALTFGIFQGVMPTLGALLGDKLDKLTAAGNYISFAALLTVGVLMLVGDEQNEKKPRFGAITILLQAVATSIDAFFCGVSLPSLSLPLYVCVIVIGATTAVLCIAGIFFSTAIVNKLKVTRLKIFKMIGGAILIALAMKELIYCFI